MRFSCEGGARLKEYRLEEVVSVREAARLVVIDAKSSVLLLRYSEGLSGESEDYWVTPGGAVEAGETITEAAMRELREETGLNASIGRELWAHQFALPPTHRFQQQRERFYLVRVEAIAPTTVNSSLESIRDQRWWTLAELLESRAKIYPADLGERVRGWLRG
jgi:8-oxo-dGTP pyrophosphatase MutT (NUDIX family)